jgi:peptidoglycan/LPS O-acetylase OafA/YrhL
VAVVFIKSWVSAASPFGKYLNLGWGATYFLTIFFSFFVLLNVDKCTRFPLFSSKIWQLPGRLAFYIYMLHFPIIIFTGIVMGMKGLVLTPQTAPQIAPRVFTMFGIATIVSIVVGLIVMLLDTKVVQPWIKSNPWYTREQAEKELAVK